MFPVVNELRNPTTSRLNMVAGMSVGTAAVLYALCAGAGYVAYGDNVESNLLVSLPGKASSRHTNLCSLHRTTNHIFTPHYITSLHITGCASLMSAPAW
jgi:amino acid permease